MTAPLKNIQALLGILLCYKMTYRFNTVDNYLEMFFISFNIQQCVLINLHHFQAIIKIQGPSWMWQSAELLHQC
jgi:hypothetical protein